MDLWTRGLKQEANLLFNRYLWICDELESQLNGLLLLPLFLPSCRDPSQGRYSPA